jgi:hypothetical protein
VASCGGGDRTLVAPTQVALPPPGAVLPGPVPEPAPAALSGDAVLMGAGDMGDCGYPGTAQTAALIQGFSGDVITLGDHAYPHGAREDFRNCYDPHWGSFRSRTYPSPGNHDMETEGGLPYYEYFGLNAGPPGRGYYSYTAGSWFVLSLNSELGAQGRDTQVEWARRELDANRTDCALAYFHRPLVSSGTNGADRMRPLARALYGAGVELILTGHEHFYERFSRQDADGRPDPAFGFDLLIVGTGGGRPLRAGARAPNSQIVLQETWGVIKLTLRPADYRWEFIQAGTGAVLDAGLGQCHDRPRTP